VNEVILSTIALAELEESFDWYEERLAGLGVRFVAVIDRALTIIANNPKAYPKKKNNYREIVINKFPFVIVYEFSNDENKVYVLHIFHTRRAPKQKYRR
jgi:plasmid stabilization system protein ParE